MSNSIQHHTINSSGGGHRPRRTRGRTEGSGPKHQGHTDGGGPHGKHKHKPDGNHKPKGRTDGSGPHGNKHKPDGNKQKGHTDGGSHSISINQMVTINQMVSILNQR